MIPPFSPLFPLPNLRLFSPGSTLYDNILVSYFLPNKGVLLHRMAFSRFLPAVRFAGQAKTLRNKIWPTFPSPTILSLLMWKITSFEVRPYSVFSPPLAKVVFDGFSTFCSCGAFLLRGPFLPEVKVAGTLRFSFPPPGVRIFFLPLRPLFFHIFSLHAFPLQPILFQLFYRGAFRRCQRMI